MKKRTISVKAPGRVCLFGEHLDYMGLYVISAAIDLHVAIHGSPRDDQLLHIAMPDIGEEERIDLTRPVEYRKSRDYLRSVVRVLLRHGIDIPRGCDCVVSGSLPIQAGVSSSSALVIAWTTFLLVLASRSEADDSELIAQYGYEAEVKEFNEAGGMMDHYTSSLGGILWIDCRLPFHVEPVYHSTGLGGIVLGDSLEKKETMEVLSSTKDDVQKGISLLRQCFPRFDLRETTVRETEPYLENLPERYRKKVLATLLDRDLTLEAKQLFVSPAGDFNRRLGSLLTCHHEQLRDGLNISTSKIERMILAAKNAGALGYKINGSGGGGCMFAFAPGKEHQVAEAIEGEGGMAYMVKVSGGVEVEENTL